MSKTLVSAVSVVTLALLILSGGRAFAEILDLGDLKLTVPPDWIVDLEKPGLSAYVEAPTISRNEYKRNIQVRSYPGDLFISGGSMSDFSEELVKNFEKASGQIREYSIRNLEQIKLASGAPAGIIYASFKISDFSMMHMHVVVSSRDKHFVITAADFEDLLDGAGEDDHLAGLWEIVNTATLASEARNPYLNFLVWVLGFALVLVVLLAYKVVRRRRESHDIAVYEKVSDDQEPNDSQQAELLESNDADGVDGSWALEEGPKAEDSQDESAKWNMDEEDIDKALDEKFG